MENEVERLVQDTQARMDAGMDARRAEIKSGADVHRKESKGGGIRRLYSFPAANWFAAKQQGAPVEDPDYLKWEADINPEFRTVFEDKPVFSLQHLTPAPGGPTKRRNRFGNVSFRKRYA